MTYELAKELKDAGFHQNEGEYFRVGNTHLGGVAQRIPWQIAEITKRTEDGQHAYIPTLSELIEACGDDMFSLTNCTKFWSVEDRYGIEVEGSTPEEAVARLWLALNKK